MPKTKKDLFLRVIEKLGGEQAELMRGEFEQRVLPALKENASWDEEMTDDEFERQWAIVEKELPAFARYLLQYPNKPLPPGFGTRN